MFVEKIRAVFPTPKGSNHLHIFTSANLHIAVSSSEVLPFSGTVLRRNIQIYINIHSRTIGAWNHFAEIAVA